LCEACQHLLRLHIHNPDRTSTRRTIRLRFYDYRPRLGLRSGCRCLPFLGFLFLGFPLYAVRICLLPVRAKIVVVIIIVIIIIIVVIVVIFVFVVVRIFSSTGLISRGTGTFQFAAARCGVDKPKHLRIELRVGDRVEASYDT
jgi:hypothetical protein